MRVNENVRSIYCIVYLQSSFTRSPFFQREKIEIKSLSQQKTNSQHEEPCQGFLDYIRLVGCALPGSGRHWLLRSGRVPSIPHPEGRPRRGPLPVPGGVPALRRRRRSLVRILHLLRRLWSERIRFVPFCTKGKGFLF